MFAVTFAPVQDGDVSEGRGERRNAVMTTEERIDKLERENRWMKRGCLIALTAVSVVLLLSLGPRVTGRAFAQDAGGPRIVEASMFRLIDSRGRSRGGLIAEGDTGVSLDLFDERGHVRVSLSLEPTNQTLSFWDKQGDKRLALSVVKDVAGIALNDERGKPRACLGLNEDGPKLQLIDGSQKVRANIFCGADDAGFSLYDGRGTARAGMGVVNAGPAVTLNDGRGTTRVALTLFKDGPGLGFFDEQQKEVWSAP